MRSNAHETTARASPPFFLGGGWWVVLAVSLVGRVVGRFVFAVAAPPPPPPAAAAHASAFPLPSASVFAECTAVRSLVRSVTR